MTLNWRFLSQKRLLVCLILQIVCLWPYGIRLEIIAQSLIDII